MEEFLNVMISFVQTLTVFCWKCHGFDFLAYLASRLLYDITKMESFLKLAQGLLCKMSVCEMLREGFFK